MTNGYMAMNQSFWRMFWRSAQRVHGPLIVISSFLLGIVFWIREPDEQVPLGIVIVVGMFGSAVLFTFVHMAYSAIQEPSGRLPRAIHSRKLDSTFDVICLLEKSELFSHGVQVSFYFKSADEFEILIGIGLVFNVQDDRSIQVGLNQIIKGQESTVKKLQDNDSDTLQRLIVKPNVPALDMYNWIDGGLYD